MGQLPDDKIPDQEPALAKGIKVTECYMTLRNRHRSNAPPDRGGCASHGLYNHIKPKQSSVLTNRSRAQAGFPWSLLSCPAQQPRPVYKGSPCTHYSSSLFSSYSILPLQSEGLQNDILVQVSTCTLAISTPHCLFLSCPPEPPP